MRAFLVGALMNNAAANLDLSGDSNAAQPDILALATPNIEASRLEHDQKVFLQDLNRRRDADLLLTPELSICFMQKAPGQV